MNRSLLKRVGPLAALLAQCACMTASAQSAIRPAVPKPRLLDLPQQACPNQVGPKGQPYCLINVQIVPSQGSSPCTASIANPVLFSGTNGTARNILVVWTLVPHAVSPNLIFVFDAGNGIQVTADPDAQLSYPPAIGNGSQVINWAFHTVNRQAKINSYVDYLPNIYQIDTSSSVPVVSNCLIGDPKIVNTN